MDNKLQYNESQQGAITSQKDSNVTLPHIFLRIGVIKKLFRRKKVFIEFEVGEDKKR